ncbi:copper resistance protein CopC [Sandaracinobacter neustonicus]|uniref:Copper resistance protein CopC n=1 Tax=Sandaracinobacter neustonicus TaxID=1715348 RepID=A0A501XPK0_9SPHN|nr:copper resistance protein CopC [Sandaracinobacter neustonicus]TPE62611.1 copper resistance protein CopC [Sandaracinobacter neustonicus]
MLFRSALFAALMVAAPAIAHPKLLASTPAGGSTTASPTVVSMQFSEALFPKLSGATLVKLGGGEPATVEAATSFAADNRGISLKPVSSLKAGQYRVDWFGVAADTHRITGNFNFTVR